MEQGVWPEQPKCGHRNTVALPRDFGPPTYFGFEPSERQTFTMTIAWHNTYWTSTKHALLARRSHTLAFKFGLSFRLTEF